MEAGRGWKVKLCLSGPSRVRRALGLGAVAEGAGCEGVGVPAGVGMKETSWKRVEGQRLSDEERAADLSALGYGSREGIFLHYLLLLICQLSIDLCPALS